MPLEPRHGRRIPSGARLARVLAGVLRAMRGHALREVAAGRAPDFAAFLPVIESAAGPLLAHEWVLGVRQARYDLRRPRRVAKAAGLPPPLTADALSAAWTVFRPEAAAAARRLVLDLAGAVTATAKDRVRSAVARGIEGGWAGPRVAAEIAAAFGPDRAFTIAATESSRAMHAGETAAYKAAGIQEVEWLCSADGCREVCQKLDGKRVKIGEAFFVSPTGGRYAAVFHPPAHPSCMCSQVAVIMG